MTLSCMHDGSSRLPSSDLGQASRYLAFAWQPDAAQDADADLPASGKLDLQELKDSHQGWLDSTVV